MLLGRQKKTEPTALRHESGLVVQGSPPIPYLEHKSGYEDMNRTDLRLGDLNSDNKLSVGQIQEALRLGLLVPMYRPTSELLCFQV